MGLEVRPLRRRLEDRSLAEVVQSGIGLSRRPSLPPGAVVIVAGLGGALAADLEPGTVFVADRVALAGGAAAGLDSELTTALLEAAARLGLPARSGGLLTATGMVTGAERARWVARGFVAVDMETAHLAGSVHRLAAIRVILDTPAHELSPRWVRPGRAALDPRLWGELAWLAARVGPYADRAARIVAAALTPPPP